jgi:hypothetical protein
VRETPVATAPRHPLVLDSGERAELI